MLELAPWNGQPYSDADPDGVMRQWVRVWSPNLILEDEQRVDVLWVHWVC